MRVWRETHPLTPEQRIKDRSRAYLNVYVQRGLVERERCEMCGRKAVEALHLDYAKPLEVRWLCRRHHLAEFHPWRATGPGSVASLTV